MYMFPFFSKEKKKRTQLLVFSETESHSQKRKEKYDENYTDSVNLF